MTDTTNTNTLIDNVREMLEGLKAKREAYLAKVDPQIAKLEEMLEEISSDEDLASISTSEVPATEKPAAKKTAGGNGERKKPHWSKEAREAARIRMAAVWAKRKKEAKKTGKPARA